MTSFNTLFFNYILFQLCLIIMQLGSIPYTSDISAGQNLVQ